MPLIPRRLTQLRKQINAIDRRIIVLLARRQKVARQIGAVKAQAGLPILDRARETSAHVWRSEIATKQKLDPASVRRIFAAIMAMAKEEQRSMK